MNVRSEFIWSIISKESCFWGKFKFIKKSSARTRLKPKIFSLKTSMTIFEQNFFYIINVFVTQRYPRWSRTRHVFNDFSKILCTSTDVYRLNQDLLFMVLYINEYFKSHNMSKYLWWPKLSGWFKTNKIATSIMQFNTIRLLLLGFDSKRINLIIKNK